MHRFEHVASVGIDRPVKLQAFWRLVDRLVDEQVDHHLQLVVQTLGLSVNLVSELGVEHLLSTFHVMLRPDQQLHFPLLVSVHELAHGACLDVVRGA